MISKRTLLILCAMLNLSFATQTMHASLWQTICSPFSSAAAYIKQRPLVAVAAALSTVAISGGIYWWYKHSGRTKKLDVNIDRDIKTFQNTKGLIERYNSVDSKIFYEQLNSFLPQVRQALKPDQQETFDALNFGSIPQGSKEYWDACAKLFFYLDDYSVSAQESLKTVRQARNQRA